MVLRFGLYVKLERIGWQTVGESAKLMEMQRQKAGRKIWVFQALVYPTSRAADHAFQTVLDSAEYGVCRPVNKG